MTYIDNSNINKKFALLSMFFGGLFMVLLVVLINKSVPQREAKIEKPARYIDMKKTLKSATKPKPKPKRKKAKKAPLPDINSLLSGIDMGIPEFDVDGIGGDPSSLLGDGVSDIMNESSVDVKPQVVSRGPISYPQSAKKKNIKGYVVVNLLINEEGEVEVSQILESEPSSIFDSSVLHGVKEWRFSPAIYKGNPVKMWVKQKIRFDFN